jgi:hypothetical protein
MHGDSAAAAAMATAATTRATEAEPLEAESGTVSWLRPGVLIVLVALVALGFGVRATAGLWSDLAGLMIGPNLPDAIHYSWWLGHTPHALGTGENPFTTLDLNWPEGVSAMNNTTLLLPAVLLTPITLLAGSLVTLNVLNILAVPACAAAGYWALRQLPWNGTRISPPAALVGGVAFAISPAIVNSLIGHVTMAFAPGLPILIALSVLAWHGDRPVRTGLLLGLVAAAQVFTGEEVLFQAVLGAAVIVLIAALSRPRLVLAAGGRLVATLAVAFAVFLPITAYPLYLQFFGPLRQKGSPFLLDFFGADVTAFTTPTDRVLLHSAAQAAASVKFAGGIEEHLAYLGWPLLITCLLTAILGRRRLPVRCAAAGLLVAMAFSLGGRLWIKGTWTEHPGPYRLFQHLPVTEASLATRFGLLAALFAAALLAFAVHGVRGLASRPMTGALLAAALSLVCLAPLLPARLDLSAAPVVPAYFSTTARQLPKDSVVMVLPYPVADRPVAMRWQSAAGYRFRMPGGYFLGPAQDGHAYVGGPADPATATLLADVARTGQLPAITQDQRDQAARDLAAWGAETVVLGPDPSSAVLQQAVSSLLGREPTQVGGVQVWSVRPGP